MPLDPYFANRVQQHRSYLVRTTVARARTTFTDAWLRARTALTRRAVTGGAPEAPSTPTASAPTASAPTASAPAPGVPEAPAAAPAPTRPAKKAGDRIPSVWRARQRAGALAWDKRELADAGTPGPDIPTEEHTIAVVGFPAVRVRVYRPAADGRPRPAVLHFFGGAFRVGGIDYPTTDATCRRRAAEADVIVIAVDYALAPEHRYPTQVEQGFAALEWAIAEHERLGIDPARMAVSGASAGGAIAAAVTLINRDRSNHPLRLQILEVPATDLTARYIDVVPTWLMGVPAFVVLHEMSIIRRAYLPDASAARLPYASPLRAENHRGLPRALILTAEYDTLRRNGSAYAAALRRDGVDATIVRYEGLGHEAPIYTGVLEASRQWHAQIVTALRTLHDGD